MYKCITKGRMLETNKQYTELQILIYDASSCPKRSKFTAGNYNVGQEIIEKKFVYSCFSKNST